MKIYVATAGEYSDFHIVAVFKNRADAESCELSDDVEEFELLDGPADVRTVYLAVWSEWEKSNHPHVESWNKEIYDPSLPDYLIRRFNPASGTVLLVEGWDKDRVFQVASEEIAKFKAVKKEKP